MDKKKLVKNIFLCLTGPKEHFLKQLKEVEEYKITEVCVFLTFLNPEQRKEIYKLLLKSCIKNIPLVHIRHDMVNEEIEFFIKNFNTKYFNTHEESFDEKEKKLGFLYTEKWKKHYDKLLVELRYRNSDFKNLDMKKIGGFCIDLSHFKAAEDRKTTEYNFIMQYKTNKNLFVANHLNGYDLKKKLEMHGVKNLSNFDYLKTIPEFLFGEIISFEMENSIKEQIEFKKYLVNFL
ncbi:MAG: hypothetical protein Q7S33_02065 [Nanoarchaeota archaeon]|nr:hypothetical protein [Nanoarchaeota archaeon]